MSDADVPRTISTYQLFILGLSLYVLAALATETLFPLSEPTRAVLLYVDSAVCIVFLFDFFFQFMTAPIRLEYLKWGWIDFISSIPMIGVLRWARVARVFRILRVLRGMRATRVLVGFALQKRAEGAFGSALLVAMLLVVFSSVAILHFEAPQSSSNIRTAEDAVWWAVVTITTVGYGDKYPVTLEGKVLAALLMTAGVAVIGTFTGFVAAWFLEPTEEEQEREMEQMCVLLSEMRAELSEIRSELASISRDTSA